MPAVTQNQKILQALRVYRDSKRGCRALRFRFPGSKLSGSGILGAGLGGLRVQILVIKVSQDYGLRSLRSRESFYAYIYICSKP